MWFLGVFFLARHKKGISALPFQKDTGLGSYSTAWTLLHKLRLGLSTLLPPRLTGKFEANETYIGGYRKGWNGRGAGQVGVAIAVEHCGHTAGFVQLAVIPRATSAVLTSFVHGSIVPEQAGVRKRSRREDRVGTERSPASPLEPGLNVRGYPTKIED